MQTCLTMRGLTTAEIINRLQDEETVLVQRVGCHLKGLVEAFIINSIRITFTTFTVYLI